MSEKSPKERFATLTVREREVLKLVCQQLRYKEVGKKLFISENTVRTHMSHVYTKFKFDDLGDTERVLTLHNVYCPLFSKEEKPKDKFEKIEIIDPEPVPLSPDEEEIIDGDEEKTITYTPKPKKGGQEKMGTGKGRRALRLVLVLIVAALIVFGGWQGLKWFSKTPVFSSAKAYEINEWVKQDDVWVRLFDYEVTQGLIRLDFEVWNKTGQDIYFSWSPEKTFSMTDNKNNRYEVFTASTREVSVESDERLHFTGHGYSTVQFEDDPLFESGVSDLYVTMEYLSKIDEAVFHIGVGK